MSATWRLAWRNLGRNRRRTAITAVALAVGVSLSVAGYGLSDGMSAELLRALTRYDLGHVQVHHPDYPRTRALADTVPDRARVEAAARDIDDVVAVAPRVYSYALLSHDGKSLGAQIVGVDPALEPKVTTLHERVVRGKYLDSAPTPWPRGRALTDAERARDDAITEAEEAAALAEIEGLDDEADEADAAPDVEVPPDAAETTRTLALALSPPPERPPRVFVGVTLAKLLGVDIGDTIHASTQTVDGAVEEVYFEIAGVYHTGTGQFDRSRVYMHLADAQRYIHLDDRVHEVAILADDPAHAGDIASALRHRIDGDGEHAALVRPWNEIRPDIQRMSELSQASMLVMIAIIFFVATLGVVNTMLMAVFERTRELGMLKAIGMSGGRIVRLIVAETVLLTLASSVIGTAIGVGLDLYMLEYGIDLSSVTGGFSVGGVGITPVFHAAITPIGVIGPTVVLGISSLVASFYPAARAARLQPAVGMRQT